MRFLLALDENQIYTDGIKLPAFSGTLDVDFNKSIRDFEADADGKIASFLKTNAQGRPLAGVKAAVDHFNSSLAAISPSYTLSLMGKTAKSVVRDPSCTNTVTAGFTYTFGPTSVRMVGTDNILNTKGVCTLVGNPSDDVTINYADLNPQEYEFLSCLPTCSYKQINRIQYIQSDGDGRTAVEWSWHTPNTNKIYSVKTILAATNPGTSLNTMIEVLTID